MKKRLALTTTVVAAVALVPVLGANAQYAPDPGGTSALTQVLPIDPGGNAALKQAKKAKKAKKAEKLVYLGRH